MSVCRYKCWRSGSDKDLHLICREGEFDALPDRIRHLGPWVGSKEGEVERLRPHYRALLAEQDFVIVHRHPYEFEPEGRGHAPEG
ncbi:MAG TPA: hypothetical protein VH913_17115 [Hyphomicrobiaceae bacterium]|jgi:hypothetical protein